MNPFVAGIFAGNPDDLSVKSALPKLYQLEELYGGLFKGFVLGAKERKKRAEQSKQSGNIWANWAARCTIAPPMVFLAVITPAVGITRFQCGWLLRPAPSLISLNPTGMA